MKGPLHLSRIGDNSSSVTVSAQILEGLLPYQIDGVRFLYQQCIRKKHNVILNSEKDMNDARQISALLAAINKCFPTLIICQTSSIPKWHYEFSKANLNIVTPNELIKDDETDIPDAVILSHEQIKHIKVLPITEWLFYIIEDIDLVIKSRFIKNVVTQFRIAITTRNFVIDDDDKLQWDILKWTNPNLIEDKDTFTETNTFNKNNLLYPFPEYWRRVSWIIYDKYKPTNTEIKEYDAAVHNWLKSINLKLPTVSNKKNSRQPRKRKLNQPSKSNKTNVNRRTIKEEKNISPVDENFEINSDSQNDETTDKHDVKSKSVITVKFSGSETEEETDLLNSFVLGKTKNDYQKTNELPQKSIETDVNTDSDENDFTFTIK